MNMEDWDEVFRKVEEGLSDEDEDAHAYLVSRSGEIIYMFCGRLLYFPDRNHYSTEPLLYVKRVKGHVMKAFVNGYIERYVRGSFAFPPSGSLASRKKRLLSTKKMGKIDVIIGRLLQKVRRERIYTMEEAEAILGRRNEEPRANR